MAVLPPSEMDVALAADIENGRDDQEKKQPKWVAIDRLHQVWFLHWVLWKDDDRRPREVSSLLCGTRDDSICQPLGRSYFALSKRVFSRTSREIGALRTYAAVAEAHAAERCEAASRHSSVEGAARCGVLAEACTILESGISEADPQQSDTTGARRSSRGRC